MGVKIDKYVDLLGRYAIYGENGYFIEPFIIHTILVDELKLGMSYNGMKEFINEASITINEDEIEEFLDKKFEEENPELKKRMETPRTTSSIIKLGKASTERFIDGLSAGRYYFEPYSLKFFKIYISILKEKCKTLFSVLEDLEKCKSGELTEETKQRFLDLDFHISNGNIYITDAERLADAIIYNFKDLYDKVKQGNNLETYLSFKESRESLLKDGIMEGEIYPSKQIQIKDSHNSYQKQFIALSDAQKEQVKKEEIECMLRFIDDDFLEDDYESKKNQLVKSIKNVNNQ